MTYYELTGDMFASGAEALVNPVNCVGVMGGGLAKAFAERFPLMELDYIEYCKGGVLRPGTIHSYYSNIIGHPWIINLPTKDDWRRPSNLNYIEAGLQALVNFVVKLRIKSVAIPALGCGLGGLDWDDVQPVIFHHVADQSNVDWFVYPPL